MSIIKRNNVVFPAFVNEILRPDWFGGIDNFQNGLPPVNVKENEKDFELELAAPGRKKEDFNVEIDNGLMTISAEQKSEDTSSDENYTRREFSYTSFKRSFSLPKTINADQINASYEDGVLKFVLPKREEALPKPKRLIEIA